MDLVSCWSGTETFARNLAGQKGYPITTCPGLGSDRRCGVGIVITSPTDDLCGVCTRVRRDERLRAQKTGYRTRDRFRRAVTAPDCEQCGGPLWPAGSIPARVRSDRRTCSDKCRQARRREARRHG